MKRHDADAIGVPQEVVDRVLSLPPGRRRLVAIAGTPASGKTTLATALTETLRASGLQAANVPMDGFHLDNRVLTSRGLLSRKGAPETFDIAGFHALMQRLRGGGEVVYPLFDRSRDLAVAGAGVVPAECDLVVVEGNYLLFDEPHWRDLAVLWDLSIWYDVPEETVRARCIRRWMDLGHAPDDARARADDNDVVNARRVMGARLDADMSVTP